MIPNPKAFVSHATVDQDRFVRGFAERLQSNGVDTWYAEWSMGPGDSLVRKILVDGLEADVFIIVLSESSVASKWVMEELDHGVVRKIENDAKLIPVLIDDVMVPGPLRATVWQRISDTRAYDKEFDRILHAIFDKSTAPPIGELPKFADARPLRGVTAVPADAVVFGELATLAVEQGHLHITGEQLQKRCAPHGLSNEAVLESVLALDQKGWIKDARIRGPQVAMVEIRLGLIRKYFELTRPDEPAVTQQLLIDIVNSTERRIDLRMIADQNGVATIVARALLERAERKQLFNIHQFLGGLVEVGEVSPLLRREIGA